MAKTIYWKPEVKFDFSFTVWGVFRRNAVDNWVAMAVIRRETKWPTAVPLVAYVAVNKTELYTRTRFVGGTFVERLSMGDQIRGSIQ